LCQYAAYAQADSALIRLTGKVTDSSGNPIGGVSITVNGSSRGTTTDLSGNYSFSVLPTDTLTFSSVGYVDQQQAVGGRTTLNVRLASSGGQALAQVVVVGYGTQKKVDVTGSTVTVTGDAIAKQSVVSVDQALQGRVAGLNVVNSGIPGSPSSVQLRGVNSVSGSTAPIYVVDGLITNDISFIDPAQIDKVDVLKDASSLAIFGVNAGNGAIMITTRKGRTGKPRLSYTGYVGVQRTNHLIRMANAAQYAELTNEQYRNAGNPPPFTDSALGKGTDWYKQILRTAIIHSNDISVSGGSQYNSYNFGGGFIHSDGTVKSTSYNNLRMHLNDEYRFGKVVKIGANINLSRYIQHNPFLASNVIKEAYNYDPTVIPFSNGKYGVSPYTNAGNPLADLNYNDQDKLTGQRISGVVYGEVSLFDRFTFRTDFNLDYNTSTEKKYTPAYFVSANQQNATSTLESWQYKLTNWYWRNYLTYDQTIGDGHHITVTAGIEARQTDNATTYLKAKSVPGVSSATEYFSLGDPSSFIISDGAVASAVFSYYGRVSYAWKDRYLLNANIRSDYASQYPSNNRNIISPAVGVGWRISEEEFMKGVKNVFDNIKLRYSWGRLPNANLPNSYIAFAQIGTLTGAGGTQPVFGGTLNPGVTALNVPNQGLTWEYTEESDPGLELGFLNNRLTVEMDYFVRKTHNLVVNVPIPSQSGPVNTEYENAGTVQNKGFEFSANWNSNRQPFKWSIGINFATLQNKMINVQNGDSIPGGSLGNGYLATITRQGLPIGTFYGYKAIGVFQTTEELSSTPHTSAAQVGDLIYRDVNKDGVIDNKDRVNLGSAIPKFTYGINTNFSWRGWDLSIDMQGVLGNKIYNGNRSVRLAGYNFDLDQFTHRWHGQGTSNSYPAALNGSDSYAYPSSFFVESGSYFRIRNLQVGWYLPMAKKWGLTTFRVFANAQNLLTIFGYHGFNPEVTGVSGNPLANGIAQTSNGAITPAANGQALNSGVDLSTYPVHTTYNLGINLGF
jgi:TonB-linked SusC/RagA family outer membrane protein